MILVPDTNAWIAYPMDFFVTPEGGGPPVRVQRRGRGAIADMVNRAIRSGNLKIPDEVAAEVHKTMKSALRSAARRAGSPAGADDGIVQAALGEFDPLHSRFAVRNDAKYLGAVGLMYADISDDPSMAGAVDRRRRVKKRHGEGTALPSAETHGADFTILSTAAALAAQEDEVRLVTSDHDFVAFADTIYKVFRVRVVDYSGL